MAAHLTQADLPESPLARASLISRIFLWWLNGLFLKGSKRDLELKDLYRSLPQDKSKLLGNNLTQTWQHELEKWKRKKSKRSSKPSLGMTIGRQFGSRYMAYGILLFVEECVVRIAQPLCLGYLINYFNAREDYCEEWEGYLYAGACIFLAGLYGVTHNSYGMGTQLLGMNVRIAASALIYRKALRLSQSALGRTNVGQLTNLLSNDVSRFDQSPPYLHYLWVGPIQTGLVMYILWGYYGTACLAGLFILGLCVAFQGYSGKLSSRFRTATANLTDRRIRLMNELLGGIRVVKMYTWEKPFAGFVDSARRAEVKVMRKTSILRSFISVLSSTSSKVILFVTLFAYVLGSGNVLTAEKVFVALSLVNTVRVNMTFVFANAVLQLAETLVSIKRLQTFLLMEEKDGEKLTLPVWRSIDEDKVEVKPIGIRMKNFSAKWSLTQSEATLSNLTLSVNGGDLVAVIGPVGSGKSSLLQAILKELGGFQGSLNVIGRIGYVPQEPWLFGGTLRENILFGRELNPDWYFKVIEACCLRNDLEMFPLGDNTSVGESGACLSGGQKARVSLARAVYSNADIYLLDDPLSAVDSKVGRHIFEKCICGLLADKTRILVTHQLQFLKNLGKIILFEGGGVKAEGKYDEVLSNENDISELLSQVKEEEDIPEPPCLDPVSNAPEVEFVIPAILQKEEASAPKLEGEKLEITDDDGDKAKVIEDESMKSGAVGWNTYWKYFRAGSGYFGLALLLILNVLTQVLLTGADWWLSFWTKTQEEDYQPPSNSTELILHQLYTDPSIQLYTYSGIMAALLICALVRTLLYFWICMNASVNLHDRMFHGVIRAPMRFFEVTPSGRLLNRVSKDVGSIDDLLPVSSFDMMDILLALLGILAIVGLANPILLAPAVILLILSYFLRGFYLKTAQSVKRLEGVTRSPVFSHLKTSLHGLTTIRAFQVETAFSNRFDDLQDMHTSSWFLSVAVIRWVAIWLNWIFVSFVGIVTFGLLLWSTKSVDGGQVGLVISSVMMLTGMLQWGVKQSAEVETQMVSVERVYEYTKIHPEPPHHSEEEGKIPPKDWPQNGEIVMTNVQLRYAPEETPVLKGISVKFGSREKIGIVGGTGAGKSSIITALFRLADHITGTIEIDGVDILQIGLHELRSKISIIPQDPILFSGSLRKNLDPLDDFQDQEIWRVLEEIQLANEIKLNHPAGLMMEVTEAGSNFSVGQRQLLCLGRAILRKNRILVMDEATANLDNETDALIQATIRRKFAHCTVLTIAHRLNTVMDSDKILVLDAGSVKEFGEPHILLQDPSSAFHTMAKNNQTGWDSDADECCGNNL